jgi:hypothetical protein
MTDIYDDTREGERAWERTAPPEAGESRPRASDGSQRHVYRRLRAQFLQRCAASRQECYFGDGPIDYRISHGDPRAATVHHTIPVAVRPDLEMETSLWAPAHDRCNKLGEAAFGVGGGVVPGSERDGLGIASEDW